MKVFEISLQRWAKHTQGIATGQAAAPTMTRLARQMEKDERFWIVSALMALFHRAGDESDRRRAFAELLSRAQLPPPGPFHTWDEALSRCPP